VPRRPYRYGGPEDAKGRQGFLLARPRKLRGARELGDVESSPLLVTRIAPFQHRRLRRVRGKGYLVLWQDQVRRRQAAPTRVYAGCPPSLRLRAKLPRNRRSL
jgi:hypothetical protein